MEYAPIKKGGSNTFLTTCLLVRAVEKVLVSMCRFPICQTEFFSLLCFNKVSRNGSSPLIFFLHSQLSVSRKIVDVMQ